jgi:hypothetical protein
MIAHVAAGIQCVSHTACLRTTKSNQVLYFVLWHPWLISLELEENTEVIPLCEGGGWTLSIAVDNIIMCNKIYSEGNEGRQEECWCSLRNWNFLRHVSFRCVIRTMGKISNRKWCKEVSKKYTFGIYYLGSIILDILKIKECCPTNWNGSPYYRKIIIMWIFPQQH